MAALCTLGNKEGLIGKVYVHFPKGRSDIANLYLAATWRSLLSTTLPKLLTSFDILGCPVQLREQYRRYCESIALHFKGGGQQQDRREWHCRRLDAAEVADWYQPEGTVQVSYY